MPVANFSSWRNLATGCGSEIWDIRDLTVTKWKHFLRYRARPQSGRNGDGAGLKALTVFRILGVCFGMLVRLFRRRRNLFLENLAQRQQFVALKWSLRRLCGRASISPRWPRPAFAAAAENHWGNGSGTQRSRSGRECMGHNWGTNRGESSAANRRQNKDLWCSAV
jgi:hypothetical protein